MRSISRLPAYVVGMVLIGCGLFFAWHAYRLFDLRQVMLVPATGSPTPVGLRRFGGGAATLFALAFWWRGARFLRHPPGPSDRV